MKTIIVAILATAAPLTLTPARGNLIPTNFEAHGADRRAIQALLGTYTKAVSTKNQPLFETLLLNKDVPFSDVSSAVQAKGAKGGTQRYEDFRRDVFGGPQFEQRFQDVHIDQDGALAQVSLVFVNTAADGQSWGWKTIQLLKVEGKWRIASEFYTGHR